MTLLEQGFVVMFLGMGIVFLLLLLLVMAVTLQAKAVAYMNTLWPEATTAPKAPICKKEPASENLDEDEKLAIIIALALHARKQETAKA